MELKVNKIDPLYLTLEEWKKILEDPFNKNNLIYLNYYFLGE